jgi:hypothetical protein
MAGLANAKGARLHSLNSGVHFAKQFAEAADIQTGFTSLVRRQNRAEPFSSYQ